ncbi:protein FMC1 homolog isoform X2 [Pongo pygmaeus]|uniref:protein FMC1 homolog isoform X2 n=1 Tax=Pongo pygmaeus TaxID=9600 RepID=UPI0023E22DE5|nr:protein FMC1 homolog isoform X2 [Pongo pygmaeus]
MASTLQPEAETDRSRRHLTAAGAKLLPESRNTGKGPAASGKNPIEQTFRGRVSKIRPICPALCAPRRGMPAFAQARELRRRRGDYCAGKCVRRSVRAPVQRPEHRSSFEGHQ